jgi:hypothetical protein
LDFWLSLEYFVHINIPRLFSKKSGSLIICHLKNLLELSKNSSLKKQFAFLNSLIWQKFFFIN